MEMEMPQFYVDEDLAALVEQLAKPKPFENLSFNVALRRVLQERAPVAKQNVDVELEQLLAEAMAAAKANAKKVPSPSATEWVSMIPELRSKKGLNSWLAICKVLGINPAGDSARRKLKKWVEVNRPNWHQVPEAE
jgi:hypothetical protein